MPELMLQIFGPDRWEGLAAIVGDSLAPRSGRAAMQMALHADSGCCTVFSSDGEEFPVTVAHKNKTYNVRAINANESSPVCFLRDLVPTTEVADCQVELEQSSVIRQLFRPYMPAARSLLRVRTRRTNAFATGEAKTGISTAVA